MNMIQLIIGFAIGGTITGAILAAYFHLTREKRRAGVFAYIGAGIRLERIAQRLVRGSEDVNYAAVMTLTNGNGHPSLSTPLYATLIASHVDELHDARHRLFERIEVDGAWRDTMMRVFLNKVQVLNVNAMTEGEMKDLYTREGLMYVELHFLKQTPNAGYYLAVGSYTQGHMQGARWDITSAKADLKKVLETIFK